MKWFILLLLLPFVIAAVCTDGEIKSCGQSSVGSCRLGQQQCISGEWSFCQGAVYPGEETCFDQQDNDCDGSIDEQCECYSGQIEKCGVSDKGICKFGARTCTNNQWASCEDAVYPLASEICSDNLDNNCNGLTDENCQSPSSCFDGIRNQGESGIDCGGPCPSCATCFDRIKNQNESGVDCGSPCSACPTCFDNIQNQNETEVDCGGPCAACTLPEELDEDEDTLTAAQELILGTSSTNPDSDRDGMKDGEDALPLCPNKTCDLNYGESTDNCPVDCPKERKFSLAYALGILGFMLLVVFAVLFRMFRKSAKTMQSSNSQKRPEEKIEIYLKESSQRSRTTKTEKDLEKSFEKISKALKRKLKVR